jgi:sugar lactone lactonase YvrE
MLEKINTDRVGTLSCSVGESPLWCAEENSWYWLDIVGKTIWRLDARSGAVRSWQTDKMIGCMALKESGGFIAGMESGIFEVRLPDDNNDQTIVQCLATPPELKPGMRFNDGRCDREGRFWSGTMVMDMAAARAEGRLYRYTKAQGLPAPFVSNLLVQNGLAWSPDGRTMYLSDSHPNSQLIWAFDYDTENGIPANQRVFVDMKQHTGRPDGAAIDEDGCYWICGNDGGRLLRFTPDGKLDREISLPMKKPSMCSFGGQKLDTLIVTSIGAGKADDDQWAGAVVLLQPGVCGMVETRFAD